MSRLDDPSYKEICRLASECGFIIELHSAKSMSKVPVLTIKIADNNGDIIAQKTQFRNESIDKMAESLLKTRYKWAISKGNIE